MLRRVLFPLYEEPSPPGAQWGSGERNFYAPGGGGPTAAESREEVSKDVAQLCRELRALGSSHTSKLSSQMEKQKQ